MLCKMQVVMDLGAPPPTCRTTTSCTCMNIVNRAPEPVKRRGVSGKSVCGRGSRSPWHDVGARAGGTRAEKYEMLVGCEMQVRYDGSWSCRPW